MLYLLQWQLALECGLCFIMSFCLVLALYVDATNLLLHGAGVDLAHVAASIVLAQFTYLQFPRVQILVHHTDACIMGDDASLQSEYSLIRSSQPAHLNNTLEFHKESLDCDFDADSRLALFFPKFLTEHVSMASLPAGYVTLLMVPMNSGSGSNCELGSRWSHKLTLFSVQIDNILSPFDSDREVCIYLKLTKQIFLQIFQ